MDKLNKKSFLEPEDEISNQYMTNANELISQESEHKNEIPTNHSDLSIYELIASLKGKIAIYENEIQNLMNEKTRMQIEIKNLQLLNSQVQKMENNDDNNYNENDFKTLQIQKNNIQCELTILDSGIEKQKSLLNNPKLISAFKNDKCPNCEVKEEELMKLTSEKKEICNAISEMKKQLEEMKKNSVEKKKKKRKKEKIKRDSSLPDIQQYFILNHKFQLVDSKRNLWHIKKCEKFIEFKEQHKDLYENPDDILKAFVDVYDKKSDDEDESKSKNGENLNENNPNENNTNENNTNEKISYPNNNNPSEDISNRENNKDKDSSYSVSEENENEKNNLP